MPLVYLQLVITSCSLFLYHKLIATFLSSPLASISLGTILSPSYLAVALAIYFANSKWSIKKAKTFYLAPLVIISTIFCCLFIFAIIDHFNLSLSELFNSSGDFFSVKGNAHYALSEQYSWPISLLLCPPFFIYGLYLNSLFVSQKSVLKTLRLEVLGVFLGSIAGIFLLEKLGWNYTFISFASLALIVSSYILLKQKKSVLAAVLILITCSLTVLAKFFVPPSHPRISARDFDPSSEVLILREDWNSYSRVQSVQISKNNKTHLRVSIGDGAGHAGVPESSIESIRISSKFANTLEPQSVLVLFAGAGAELTGLKQLSPSPNRIVGVELNQLVVEHGAALSNLPPISKDPLANLHIKVSDARTYLERDPEQFDAIVFSWSGATAGFFSGAAIQTTQYAFTREAIGKAIQKLTKNGVIYFFGFSKLNILAHLRALDIPELNKKVVLLGARYIPWDSFFWDNHVLIYSKENLTKENLVKINQVSEQLGHYVIAAPNQSLAGNLSNENFKIYSDLINSNEWQRLIYEWGIKNNLIFFSRTDDNPFVYKMWKTFKPKSVLAYSSFVFSVALSFVFLILIFKNVRTRLTSKLQLPLLSFHGFWSGVCAQTVQLFFIFKLILFLGLPGYVFIFCILFSAVSSYICLEITEKIKPSAHNVTRLGFLGLTLFSLSIFVLHFDNVKHLLFNLPPLVTGASLTFVALCVLVPLGFLYPYCLQVQKSEGSWKSVTFNVLGWCWAALTVPLLIGDFGITNVMTVVILVTVASYAFIYFTKPLARSLR
jgi:hypothetical protein